VETQQVRETEYRCVRCGQGMVESNIEGLCQPCIDNNHDEHIFHQKMQLEDADLRARVRQTIHAMNQTRRPFNVRRKRRY